MKNIKVLEGTLRLGFLRLRCYLDLTATAETVEVVMPDMPGKETRQLSWWMIRVRRKVGKRRIRIMTRKQISMMRRQRIMTHMLRRLSIILKQSRIKIMAP